jgi:ketosteroid isomerase-like protein
LLAGSSNTAPGAGPTFPAMNENKQRITAALLELGSRNSAPWLELFADDIAYTIKGTTSWSGTVCGKEAVVKMLREVVSHFEGRPRFVLGQVIAEGDLVVATCTGDNELRVGGRYENEYCFVCRFEAGRIKELTEYLDTALVDRVLPPKA